MVRHVLIGKERRVTLEELESVALQDGILEMHKSEDAELFDSMVDGLSTALATLTLQDSKLLSAEEALATLTLLALNVSQGRVVPRALALKLASVLVDLVLCLKTSARGLSSDPATFQSTLVSVLETVDSEIGTALANLPLAVVQRTLELAVGALATIRATALAGVTTSLAALSAERCRGCLDDYAEIRYDIHRPHRGLITSAGQLRSILNKSQFVTVSNPSPSSSIANLPQYVGPAQDALATACKILELELNCFETNASDVLDGTVSTLALEQAHLAAHTLYQRTLERMGQAPDIQILTLTEAVDKLQAALQAEATLNVDFIQTENDKAAQEAKEKEAAKAARAATMSVPEDEFADKTEDEIREILLQRGIKEGQVAKVLKKRAEKQAKAAARAEAKKDKVVSLFGDGSQPICDILKANNFVLNQATIQQIEQTVDKLLSGGVQRKPKIPKGTRDYLPAQMRIRQQAFSIIRRVFEAHGAVEIDTPVFELKDTLTGKYGEDSKLIYDLADQGGELLALRYDLTVPFARFLALNAVGNIKRYHIGKVYRRDRPVLSKGRYREFYQCDFDIAGNYGRMVPDSESLCVVCDILDALPIGDFGVKVNHRRLLDAILDLCGVPSEKFRTICSAVDKLDKEPWEEVKREMVEDKGLKSEVADKIGTFVLQRGEPWEMYNSLMDGKKFGEHKGALDAMEDLRILFEYLEAMGKLKFMSFDLSLARGLDYYTGVIYEAVCLSGTTQVGSIGGGGRYDNLVSMFQEAGKITPCVGVSVGIERVFTLMEKRLEEERGDIKQPNVNVLVASAGDGMMKEKMRVARILWDANISAEFNQQDNPKLKYEIANALDREIPFMVIVGEEEAKENKCNLKDLKARTEESVSLDDLVKTLRRKGVIPVGCEFAAELLSREGSN
jgi:histidyl-tRNA synthetase